MLSIRSTAFFGAGAVALAFAIPAAAQPHCPVVDSFASFLDLSARTAALPVEQQALAFRRDYLAQHRDLYAAEVMPMPQGAALDAMAVETMAGVRTHPEFRTFDAQVSATLRLVVDRFGKAFPDFRCDFPIHATETFGFMDGAGRTVGGRPALVLGVDTIAGFWTPETMPVFLSHELFHRYHFQAAGFSDDLAERDLIWRSLWVEGLATFVSARLNPSNSLTDALAVPRNLDALAKPFVPKMAAALLAAADRVDPEVFGLFFTNENAEAARRGWPSRAGYYLGYRIAEDLARNRSLSTLAHLKGPALRAAIRQSLERLSRGG
jgi:hypothetical protein